MQSMLIPSDQFPIQNSENTSENFAKKQSSLSVPIDEYQKFSGFVEIVQCWNAINITLPK